MSELKHLKNIFVFSIILILLTSSVSAADVYMSNDQAIADGQSATFGCQIIPDLFSTSYIIRLLGNSVNKVLKTGTVFNIETVSTTVDSNDYDGAGTYTVRCTATEYGQTTSDDAELNVQQTCNCDSYGEGYHDAPFWGGCSDYDDGCGGGTAYAYCDGCMWDKKWDNHECYANDPFVCDSGEQVCEEDDQVYECNNDRCGWHVIDSCNGEDSSCGDGHKDPGEECDDGNTISGDGCSSSCKDERPDETNLRAWCIEGDIPKIHLEWDPVSSANSNSIQKGDSYPHDPQRFWEFIFEDRKPFSVYSYVDSNIEWGTEYSYRIKTHPQVASNVVQLTCTSTPSNHPPTAFNSNEITNEDTPKNIILQASDPDSDPLTYIIVSNPSHGFLTGSGSSRTYNPNQDYNGPDSFTFRVHDGTTFSNKATVSITVNPVPDAPTAFDQTVTTNEDTPKNIILQASDPDGDPLTYNIIDLPLNGILTGSGASRTYTPNADFVGPDSFTFQVNDGTFFSNIATVTIHVLPVNDPPEFIGLGIPDQTILEDSGLNDNLVDLHIYTFDSDDPLTSLTYTILSQSNTGVVVCSIDSNRFVDCTTQPDQVGFSDIEVQVTDPTGGFDIDTFKVNVIPVNDPPELSIPDQSVLEDSGLNNDLVDLHTHTTDPDDLLSSLTYTILSQSDQSIVSCTLDSNRFVDCTTQPDQDGFSDIEVQVTDPTGGFDIDTFRVNVIPVNDPPEFIGLGIPDQTILEDSGLNNDLVDLHLYTFDSDDPLSSLTYAITSQSNTSVVVCSVDSDRYIDCTTQPNQNGFSDVTVQVTDPSSSSDTDTFRVHVIPINDPPTAFDQVVVTDEDTPVPITLVATDPEGDH